MLSSNISPYGYVSRISNIDIFDTKRCDLMAREKRQVKSLRIKPTVFEKMHCIRRHLSIDTTWWNSNKHNQKLGYMHKGAVSNADVLEIAVNNLYDQMFQDRK